MSNTQFQIGQTVVYPAHGVGELEAVETSQIAGNELKVYVLKFDKEKLTLRVPVSRAAKTGLRHLCEEEQIEKALAKLKTKAKASRGMWSRRALDLGNKINSGCVVQLAEVVRDLYKNIEDPERSYSEKSLYEQAFTRLMHEVAAVKSLDYDEAEQIIRGQFAIQ